MWGHGVRSAKDSMTADALQSMYARIENCPKEHKALPETIYRHRHGVMTLKNHMDDELANAGGMYANKATKNPQAYGQPACGRSQSSCGSISGMIAKMGNGDIAGLAPSERNKVDTFSSRAIARLARNKEQKDEMAVVEKKTAEAESKEEPVKMGEMVAEIKEKAEMEAEDIVRTEEHVKRDVLGRPCPPGTYKLTADAIKPAMKELMQKKMATDDEQKPMEDGGAGLTPAPMFASLRETDAKASDALQKAVAVAANDAKPSNMERVDATKAEQAAKIVVEEPATAGGAAVDDAGATPTATGFEIGTLPLIALIGLAVLALLLIAGFVSWLMSRGKPAGEKPKGFIGKTVRSAGEAIGGVIGAAKKAVGSAVEGVVATGKSAVGGAVDVGSAALDVGEAAVGTVGKTAGALLEGDIAGAGRAAVSGVTDVARKTIDVGTTALGGVADVAGTAVGGVGEVAGAAVEGGAAALGGAKDIASGVFDVVTGADDSNNDNDDNSEPVVEEEEDSASVGVNDIEEAFGEASAGETTAPAADATEDVQARVNDLIAETAPLLDETEEISETPSDIAREGEAVMDAFADEARATADEEEQ